MSSNGTLVLLLNTLNEIVTKEANWGKITGLSEGASYAVTDAWTGASLGCQTGGLNVTADGHDIAVLLVQRCETTNGETKPREWHA